MRNALRLIIVMAVVLMAIGFCGCSSQEEGNKYGIHNYTIVYCSDGKVEYQNYGPGTTEQTVYELASNGKTVAAVVALRMVDEGLLSLDEQIYPYLDAGLLTDDPRLMEITLEELLCHTAGFSPSYELGVDKKL